jgi:hypothetical protein
VRLLTILLLTLLLVVQAIWLAAAAAFVALQMDSPPWPHSMLL